MQTKGTINYIGWRRTFTSHRMAGSRLCGMWRKHWPRVPIRWSNVQYAY